MKNRIALSFLAVIVSLTFLCCDLLPESDTTTKTVQEPVEVVEKNLRPVVSAGSDRTVDAGTVVLLEASATDIDGSVVGYLWEVTAETLAPVLVGATTKNASITAPDVSAATDFHISVTATDDQGAGGYATMVITVVPVVALVPGETLVATLVTDAGKVPVSVVDGVGFDPNEHGYCITNTFLQHTSNASLYQLTNSSSYQIGDARISSTKFTGYTHHALNHGGGIFFTATDGSPMYSAGSAS